MPLTLYFETNGVQSYTLPEAKIYRIRSIIGDAYVPVSNQGNPRLICTYITNDTNEQKWHIVYELKLRVPTSAERDVIAEYFDDKHLPHAYIFGTLELYPPPDGLNTRVTVVLEEVGGDM